jgi:2-succinyl-6-hydroxy-2,4-cyclohexadiene-1-carboxylate synthase
VNQILVIGASLGLYQEEDREIRRQADRQWSDPLWMSTSTNDFLRAWNQQPLLARLQTLNPKQALKLSIHRKTHHPQGLAIAFDSLGLGEMPPLHDHLATIASPITWVYGAEDEKYESIARQASELHPSSTLVPVPHTGHAPHLEDFEMFWDQVSHLLRREEPPY